MDGLNNQRPNFGGPAAPVAHAPKLEPQRDNNKKNRDYTKVLKLAYSVLLVGVLVLVVGVVLLVSINHSPNEADAVNANTYQAVFINVTGSNGGQAYFGHIVAINNEYIELNDVFYLQPGQNASSFTLNKLTCALYTPTDPMLINKSQVDFWENLSSSSQIAQDINKWNTEKLQCATPSTSQTSSNNNTNPSTSSSTTPSSSTTSSSTTPSSTSSTSASTSPQTTPNSSTGTSTPAH